MAVAADRKLTRWSVFNRRQQPTSFHRIRHFGLIANNGRKEKLALARELLGVVTADAAAQVTDAHATSDGPVRPNFVCTRCGAQMFVVESFVRGQTIRAPPFARGAL